MLNTSTSIGSRFFHMSAGVSVVDGRMRAGVCTVTKRAVGTRVLWWPAAMYLISPFENDRTLNGCIPSMHPG